MVRKKLECRRIICATSEKEILEKREVQFSYDGADSERVEEAKKELAKKYPSALITTARDIRTFYMRECDFIKAADLFDEEGENGK